MAVYIKGETIEAVKDKDDAIISHPTHYCRSE